MGEMSDDILDGKCCALCGMYFDLHAEWYGYGHPVVCDGCWDEDCGYPCESSFTPMPPEFKKQKKIK